MAYITESEYNAHIKTIETAAMGGDTPEWKHIHKSYNRQRVTLYLSFDSLSNPAISGAVWAWKKLGMINATTITEGERIRHDLQIIHQGLEGLYEVTGETLMGALFAMREIGFFGCAIKLEAAQTKSKSKKSRKPVKKAA